MPGNPAQPESNKRTRRGPPGFVSTRFRPFLILYLRHAEVRKMRGGLSFPASSPWVLAVGGTEVVSGLHTPVSETVWNDGSFATGGGVSDVFERPSWQPMLRCLYARTAPLGAEYQMSRQRLPRHLVQCCYWAASRR